MTSAGLHKLACSDVPAEEIIKKIPIEAGLGMSLGMSSQHSIIC